MSETNEASPPPDGIDDAILRTFVSPSSRWLPRRTVLSAWLEHAPFAFWLVEVSRPRVLVELGVHNGFSYFAFCQAIQQLRLGTRCYAVDTWKGDEHAGFYGEEVFEDVRAYNDQFYSAFSALMRTTFNDAARHFIDGTVDLLHIDGRHRYEDVKGDFETWRPRLSNRSIVLFHDTNIRRLDFGVYRLWDELRAEYPYFEFHHGAGLGVLGTGTNLPDAVRALFEAAGNESATAQIRRLYGRLGATISAQFFAQDRAAQSAKQEAAMDAPRREPESFKSANRR